MTLDEEVIIVTGASRGLGRSMCERFATEGARVVLTARDAGELEAVATDLPTESLVVPADARDADDVARVVEETVDTFGRVDTLVNNAGVSLLGVQGDRELLPDGAGAGAGSDDAVDAADAPDVDGQAGVAPAVATSTWHADGAECDRCGEQVERRWREADAFVCADCASW